MKLSKLLTLLLLPLAFASADENHKDGDHDHKGHDHGEHAHKIKAPNGGRILHDIVPHAEFFVTKERKIQITFVNDAGKAISSKQTLTAIGGKRSKPTNFKFEKTAHGFISKEKLPAGKLVPVVLTFADENGKKKRVRFNVNLSDCPTCEFKEYACSCDHSHDHDHKHDHGHKH